MASSFDLILRFLSSGIEIQDEETALAALIAGHRYCVGELVVSASSYLLNNLTNRSVLPALQSTFHCTTANNNQQHQQYNSYNNNLPHRQSGPNGGHHNHHQGAAGTTSRQRVIIKPPVASGGLTGSILERKSSAKGFKTDRRLSGECASSRALPPVPAGGPPLANWRRPEDLVEDDDEDEEENEEVSERDCLMTGEAGARGRERLTGGGRCDNGQRHHRRQYLSRVEYAGRTSDGLAARTSSGGQDVFETSLVHALEDATNGNVISDEADESNSDNEVICVAGCEELLSHCLRYVDLNAGQLLDSELMTELDLPTLGLLLSRDSLQVRSELAVVRALHSWKEAHTKTRPPDLEGVQYLVRYLTLSEAEFEDGVVGTGLLSEQEEESILEAITGTGELPEHLQHLRYLMSCPRSSPRKRKSRIKQISRSSNRSNLLVPKEKLSVIDEIFLCLACVLD